MSRWSGSPFSTPVRQVPQMKVRTSTQMSVPEQVLSTVFGQDPSDSCLPFLARDGRPAVAVGLETRSSDF